MKTPKIEPYALDYSTQADFGHFTILVPKQKQGNPKSDIVEGRDDLTWSWSTTPKERDLIICQAIGYKSKYNA